jgi:hypothetical protein
LLKNKWKDLPKPLETPGGFPEVSAKGENTISPGLSGNVWRRPFKELKRMSAYGARSLFWGDRPTHTGRETAVQPCALQGTEARP